MKDLLHHQVPPREPLQELLLKNISNIYNKFIFNLNFQIQEWVYDRKKSQIICVLIFVHLNKNRKLGFNANLQIFKNNINIKIINK